MLGRKYFEEQFAGQFEPDEAGFLYRRNMREAPVRVTARERDVYVATFARKAIILTWSLAAGLLIMSVAMAIYATAHAIELEKWWVYLGPGVVGAAFMLAWFRIWNAPAADLKTRTPVGKARSRANVRHIMLAKMSWGHVTFVFAMVVFAAAVNLPSEAMGIGDWVPFLFLVAASVAWCWIVVEKLQLRD